MSNRKTSSIINRIVLLAGAFTFAFLFGEMVHEYGHYFSHLIFGNSDVQVYLNPFGSSHIMGVTSLPLIQMGVTSAAGPLFNLLMGSLTLLLLWKVKKPGLLPFLLWGPVAMIQESVTFTFGFLTPGGDAEWIAAMGIPKVVIIGLGVLSLIAGLILLAVLLTNLGITTGESFGKRLVIVLLGMCSLMLIRFIYSAVIMPASMIENLVPLVFSLLLAIIVVMIQPVVKNIIWKNQLPPVKPIEKKDILIAGILGVGIFIFQILYPVLV